MKWKEFKNLSDDPFEFWLLVNLIMPLLLGLFIKMVMLPVKFVSPFVLSLNISLALSALAFILYMNVQLGLQHKKWLPIVVGTIILNLVAFVFGGSFSIVTGWPSVGAGTSVLLQKLFYIY